jgi:uncharacterized protein (DUF2267 family)
LLNEIEHEYDWPKSRRNQSYAALRAVLHALRDRLPVDESVQFAAQLPMLVRGVYYDGWDPSRVPIKMSLGEFEARVRREFPFHIPGDIDSLIAVVLHALHRYGSAGEWADIRAHMPKDYAAVLP